MVGVLLPASTSPIHALLSAIATVGLAFTVNRMVSLHAPKVYLNLYVPEAELAKLTLTTPVDKTLKVAPAGFPATAAHAPLIGDVPEMVAGVPVMVSAIPAQIVTSGPASGLDDAVTFNESTQPMASVTMTRYSPLLAEVAGTMDTSCDVDVCPAGPVHA